MTNKFFVFVLAVCFTAVSSLGLVAQMPPGSIQEKGVGFEKAPNGPPIIPIVPLDPITGLCAEYQFPPVMDNNESHTMVVYKKDELDFGAGQIIKLRIPIKMSPPEYGYGNVPHDLWEDFVYSIYVDDAGRKIAGAFAAVPPNISIHIKNGAAFTARTSTFPVDSSSANGWRKVWSGTWDFKANPQQWEIDDDGTAYLVIPFSTAFDYTGGDITIMFSNLSGPNGKITNWNDMDYTNLSLSDLQTMGPYNYGFEIFITVDEAAGAYLGPYHAYDGGVKENWTLPYILPPYPDDYDNSPNTFTTAGRIFLNPGPIPVSYRPKMLFTLGMQTLNNPTYSPGSGISESVLTPRDTVFTMADINLDMISKNYPLRFKSLRFSTKEIADGVYPKAKLYYAPQGSVNANAVLKGEITPTSDDIYEFLLYTEGTQGSDDPDNPVDPVDPVPAFTLAEGTNRFIIVFEMPRPVEGNGIGCGGLLSLTLIDYTLGDREGGLGIDDNENYIIPINRTFQRTLRYEMRLLNLDNLNKRICFEEGSQEIYLNVLGNVAGGSLVGTYYDVRWDRSKDNGATWLPEDTTVSTNHLYVFGKDMDYNAYRVRVITPDGCPDTSQIYRIAWEQTNKESHLTYTGSLNLQDLFPGSVLTFTSASDIGTGSIPVYRWQVNINNRGFMDIPGASSPTLSYTVPENMTGECEIRLRIDAAKPQCVCETVIISDTISFKITGLEEFTFVTHPPANKYLCPTTPLNLQISYAGRIDLGRSCWLKDGRPYCPPGSTNPVRSRTLSITTINFFTTGEYRYMAVDTVTRFENGQYVKYSNDTTYSEICRVNILPPLEIYYVSQSQNYVMPGKAAGFTVHSSFSDNEGGASMDTNDQIGFQWYRSDNSTPLEDNYYFKGTKSNALVITNAPDPNSPDANKIYTFNCFYYLEITGPCGKVDSRRHPIFLLPGEGVEFIKNNKDAVECAGGSSDTVVFEVEVETVDMEMVKYQWYIDGIPATDGINVIGSSTSKLTLVNPNPSIRTYCNINAFLHNYYIDVNSDEAGIEVIDMTYFSRTPYSTINVLSLTPPTLPIGVVVTTNKPTGSFVFDVIIVNDNIPETLSVYTETFSTGPNGQSSQQTFSYNVPVATLQGLSDAWSGDYFNLIATVKDDCGNIVKVDWILDMITTDEEEGDEDEISYIKDIAFNQLELSPNPTNGIINISYYSDVEIPTLIELCGLAGNTISALFEGISNIGDNRFTFDLSKLNIPSGTYVLMISNTNGLVTKQFILVK